jgi:hypothetical protein
MVDSVQVYALTGEAPWIDFPNPGYHRQADGTLDACRQQDADEIFQAATAVYNSQQNVKGAVNDALNEAVRRAQRRNPNVMGVREFRSADDPRKIIEQLTSCYGQKQQRKSMNTT